MTDATIPQTESLEIHHVGSYTFSQTGNSTKENNMGMREMQARAYAKRDSKYLLIQAPPASGKSRALMFLALDKIIKQGVSKAIIAVPQIAIGSSFADVKLTEYGFFADWKLNPVYNLCTPGGEAQKVQRALEFLNDPNAHYLLCSHATLTFFFAKVPDKSVLNNCLFAIDEFHHVSEDSKNRLGEVIHVLMKETSAQIVAMTGSYFRGDSVPVLSTEDEQLFDRVTYTYYEQLNGYKYLKSLGIDYAFYEGKWLDAVEELIDTDRKMIIHIPSVNSKESTHDKTNEVSFLFDAIGKIIFRDPDTGIYTFESKSGRTLKVVDLVNDIDGKQGTTLAALRKEENLKSLNIIIALGMAKEGFDWPQCEYALTVGYRSSLTEVVQIIGRATRDYEGKTHAQFTNLLAMPQALLDDVTDAVNTLLKAITLSLLMEQVLAPNVHFRKRSDDPDTPEDTGTGCRGKQKPNTDEIEIIIDDDNVSDNAVNIINSEGNDIISRLLNDSVAVKNALVNGGEGVARDLAEDAIVDVVREMHPELSDEDVFAIAHAIATTIILKSQSHRTDDTGDGGSKKPFVVVGEDNTQFVNINGKFVNIDELDFSLIEAINPFADAYQFISKTIDPELLKRLQEETARMREKMTMDKAMELWPYINRFVEEHNRKPDIDSTNDFERRLAIALAMIAEEKRKRNAKEKAEGNP
ncbi:MAG: ATP-dependent helicase [Succinimonas sp.]|nr:ATP-dependent helicase [Succinimonas sp.]